MKGSSFSVSKPSLWGESEVPRFVNARHTPSMRSPQSAQKPQGGSGFSSASSTSRTYAAPSTARKAMVVEAPSSPRRLVSANAAGGATRVAQLTPGQFIEHERFGVGEVLKVEGAGENIKAHIRFKNAGEKQLLLKFARFRVLG